MSGRGRGGCRRRVADGLRPAAPPPVLVLAACIGILAATGPARAGEFDDIPWTEGSGTVTLGEQSYDQARAKALGLARSAAIAAVTGIGIHDLSERVLQEDAQEVLDEFRQLIATEVSGHIVEESEPVYRIEPAGDGVFAVVCEIRARVVREEQKADPAFQLQVGIVGNETGRFRSGDELVLEVVSTLDCYIHVFSVYADGTYNLLFPNPAMTDNSLRAERARQIPDPEQRRRQNRIILQALPDRDVTREYIFVVGSIEPYPFLGSRTTELGGSFLPTPQSDPADFARWLLDIPANKRCRAEAFYSVAR